MLTPQVIFIDDFLCFPIYVPKKSVVQIVNNSQVPFWKVIYHADGKHAHIIDDTVNDSNVSYKLSNTPFS